MSDGHPTQNERILTHLKSGRPLTALEALTEYGVIQLPARIYELKRDGHRIRSRRRVVINRFGDRVRVNEYRLDKEATPARLEVPA